ncbi:MULTISPECIES: ATP-binding protein [unclassified Streptomyces]|uniref:ATP-binding protein n=1 Tax=unclassified Streptomyces TaxID=2593676 RepID=UPI002E2C6B38|nr:ATP-binding protein [Streptomyces sp. NBC_00223]
MTANAEETSLEEVDLTPTPQLLEALGDIPYKPWQCLAELIDNSFDDFLSDPDRGEQREVWITLPKPTDDDPIVGLLDNGRGMSLEALQSAVKAGYSGKRRYGSLGLFGMGFNIATARLGNRTEVRTTRAGDADWLIVEIDLRRLARNDSFRAPLRREPKQDVSDHGTEVIVRHLRTEIADDLKKANRHTSVRADLGRVYSYLLRGENPVPGVPDGPMAGRGFRLKVNGKTVSPRLPCVWSASRTVTRQGREIAAVRPVDIRLASALACMKCGHWQSPDLALDQCAQCDSDDMQLRERRIHGWFGVQRYLDETDYGIDFLRNGRKIRIGDRSLFSWENPDDGSQVSEYPVDIPATQGRIVGEIHLDHVPVGYQKTDFNRESRDWRQAVIALRGEGPMRPKKAVALGYPLNASPLGEIFKGYQENRPGAGCLIPGNGSVAVHDAAREWGVKFHSGRHPEFLSDEIWYQAVLAHDEARDSGGTPTRPTGPDGAGNPTLTGRTGLTPLGGASTGGTSLGGESPVPQPAPPSAPVETEEQRFERYRADARQVFDLTGEVTLPRLGRRAVTVFDTPTPLLDDHERQVPSLARMGKGVKLEVFVHGEHPVFREYGRDPRDYALMEIAQTLHAFEPDGQKVTAVAAEVTRQFPDQRVTESALRDRADSLLGRVRELMTPIVGPMAGDLWDALPERIRLRAEQDAGRADASLDWPTVVKDGAFVAHLDATGIAAVVRTRPADFLDGTVFTTSWSGWSDSAVKERQVTQTVRPLEVVGEFLADPGGKTRLELSLARITFDMLERSVAGPV